ncbi:inner nuclear membrane protein enriched at telomere/subtelomere region [Puccinia graminis f. sp. tritici]|uniref:Inner nuclear membrane protein enriched at telomere/subtelomere region n=1 Tax=Puccinia graminis f. sp. tritici TaxID=56615 RepID=A0A5B0MA71_PUCGR|nr:inner nuclear membrane protein enriched at telomere/subtelomere region [Puccinia graminis f. sp. tritici]
MDVDQIISSSTNPEPPPDWMLPDFDPLKVKVSQLREILQLNSIRPASSNKKVDHAALYKKHILPKIHELLEAHCSVKASCEGIFDMRTGRYMTDESLEVGEPSNRRKTPIRTRSVTIATQADNTAIPEIPQPSAPAVGSTPSRRGSSKTLLDGKAQSQSADSTTTPTKQTPKRVPTKSPASANTSQSVPGTRKSPRFASPGSTHTPHGKSREDSWAASPLSDAHSTRRVKKTTVSKPDVSLPQPPDEAPLPKKGLSPSRPVPEGTSHPAKIKRVVSTPCPSPPDDDSSSDLTELTSEDDEIRAVADAALVSDSSEGEEVDIASIRGPPSMPERDTRRNPNSKVGVPVPPAVGIQHKTAVLPPLSTDSLPPARRPRIDERFPRNGKIVFSDTPADKSQFQIPSIIANGAPPVMPSSMNPLLIATAPYPLNRSVSPPTSLAAVEVSGSPAPKDVGPVPRPSTSAENCDFQIAPEPAVSNSVLVETADPTRTSIAQELALIHPSYGWYQVPSSSNGPPSEAHPLDQLPAPEQRHRPLSPDNPSEQPLIDLTTDWSSCPPDQPGAVPQSNVCCGTFEMIKDASGSGTQTLVAQNPMLRTIATFKWPASPAEVAAPGDSLASPPSILADKPEIALTPKPVLAAELCAARDTDMALRTPAPHQASSVILSDQTATPSSPCHVEAPQSDPASADDIEMASPTASSHEVFPSIPADEVETSSPPHSFVAPEFDPKEDTAPGPTSASASCIFAELLEIAMVPKPVLATELCTARDTDKASRTQTPHEASSVILVDQTATQPSSGHAEGPQYDSSSADDIEMASPTATSHEVLPSIPADEVETSPTSDSFAANELASTSTGRDGCALAAKPSDDNPWQEESEITSIPHLTWPQWPFTQSKALTEVASSSPSTSADLAGSQPAALSPPVPAPAINSVVADEAAEYLELHSMDAGDLILTCPSRTSADEVEKLPALEHVGAPQLDSSGDGDFTLPSPWCISAVKVETPAAPERSLAAALDSADDVDLSPPSPPCITANQADNQPAELVMVPEAASVSGDQAAPQLALNFEVDSADEADFSPPSPLFITAEQANDPPAELVMAPEAASVSADEAAPQLVLTAEVDPADEADFSPPSPLSITAEQANDPPAELVMAPEAASVSADEAAPQLVLTAEVDPADEADFSPPSPLSLTAEQDNLVITPASVSADEAAPQLPLAAEVDPADEADFSPPSPLSITADHHVALSPPSLSSTSGLPGTQPAGSVTAVDVESVSADEAAAERAWAAESDLADDADLSPPSPSSISSGQPDTQPAEPVTAAEVASVSADETVPQLLLALELDPTDDADFSPPSPSSTPGNQLDTQAAATQPVVPPEVPETFEDAAPEALLAPELDSADTALSPSPFSADLVDTQPHTTSDMFFAEKAEYTPPSPSSPSADQADSQTAARADEGNITPFSFASISPDQADTQPAFNLVTAPKLDSIELGDADTAPPTSPCDSCSSIPFDFDLESFFSS